MLLDCAMCYLVTVVDSGGDLSEYPPRLLLCQDLAFTEEVIQLAASCVLHHEHDLLSVLKHLTEIFIAYFRNSYSYVYNNM